MTSSSFDKAKKKLIKRLEKFKVEVEAEMEKHAASSGVRLMTTEYCQFYNLRTDITKLLNTLKNEPRSRTTHEANQDYDNRRLRSLKKAIKEETQKSLDRNKVVLG